MPANKDLQRPCYSVHFMRLRILPDFITLRLFVERRIKLRNLPKFGQIFLLTKKL